MQKGELKIIGFFSEENSRLELTKSFCADHEIQLILFGKSGNTNELFRLREFLQKETENALFLVLDLDFVLISSAFPSIKEKLKLPEDEVIFAASPYFRFEHPDLHYFYWKHYPRNHDRFNYLDASAFGGKAESLLVLFTAILDRYADEAISGRSSLQYLASRFYVDSWLGCFTTDVRINLDHQNIFFSSTRLSAASNTRKKSWMYNLLYSKNEQRIFKDAGFTDALKYPGNITLEEKIFYNRLSGTQPLIVTLTADATGPTTFEKRNKADFTRLDKLRIAKLVLIAYLQTLKQLWYVRRINGGKKSAERIFRYMPNKNKNLSEATEKIIQKLEQRLPVSFAHYNDGELTFIKDYLADRDHDKWFGRKQQQYNPLLAERLYEAMQFRKEGYFVGVPCSVHHPGLRKLADQVVGDYENKVPAMTIHHNLALMPRLLYSLRGRTVFFFTNEYQDLSFFESLGIEVDPEKVFKVPFRNSYLEYEHYKNMRFPEMSVVVLTCGMLAKILTKTWYEKHDNLSVLALGSSLDDHIQKENIEFGLYPEDLPLTKNRYKSRAFLFGYKKTCRECFCY